MSSPSRLPGLREKLHAEAARVLTLPHRLLTRPVVARDRNRRHEAVVIVMPRGHAEIPLPHLAGKWFSPDEERIWNALARGPLRGSALADALGEELTGRLKMILSNLVDRDCIKSGAKGYCRNRRFLPKPPKS